MLREFGFKNKMDFRVDFRHDVSFFSSDTMENTDTFLSAAFFFVLCGPFFGSSFDFI